MKIRERGIVVGKLPTGRENCITDVTGVMVGHYTVDQSLEEDEYACTGVTAILPHGGNLFQEKVVAASHVLNGFGKTTGLVQVNELGVIESPIMLTNTFAVPAVTHGTLQYMLERNPEIGETEGTINIVVGECNDSYLNSIRKFSIKPEHAISAIDNATSETTQEGDIGAGKGMVCFGYKGGIGSSSRVVEGSSFRYTVGVLVLTNFGKEDEFLYKEYRSEDSMAVPKSEDGSIIIVMATDAPLSDRQLLRVAKRCGIGLGRTGSHYSHGSGDIVISFSTAHRVAHYSQDVSENRSEMREDNPIMNDLFRAAAEATEEAILNSLSQAETTSGRHGRKVHQFPFKNK